MIRAAARATAGADAGDFMLDSPIAPHTLAFVARAVSEHDAYGTWPLPGGVTLQPASLVEAMDTWRTELRAVERERREAAEEKSAIDTGKEKTRAAIERRKKLRAEAGGGR